MNGVPCAHHTELCITILMEQNIPTDGRIPIVGVKAVKVKDRRGVVFEERPEGEVFAIGKPVNCWMSGGVLRQSFPFRSSASAGSAEVLPRTPFKT
jgi:hypothetical protein